MADEKKRIIDLSELSQEVQVGQYILVDSASGTGKMNLKKIVDDSTTSLAERVTDLETGLTEEENARIAADTELSGNVSNLQTALETKADNDGYYPDLYAGNLSSTKKQTDSTPYLMRKTGGDLSRIGEREDDALVGATVNVNQMINIGSSDSSKTESGITITDNRDGSYTVSGTATANVYLSKGTVDVISGHKYLWKCTPLNGSSSTYRSYITSNSLNRDFDYGNGVLYNASSAGFVSIVPVYIFNGATVNNLKFVPQLIDLTAMFGSTIADYLYSLETATAGAGITKLREWGFLTEEYIPYNPGSLESVEATAHKMVGFNQWDEVWEVGGIDTNTGVNVSASDRIRSVNYIRVIPNTAYYFKSPNTIGLRLYDTDKNYIDSTVQTNLAYMIPSDVHFIRFIVLNTTTYNHDICINLSSDRNGEYEPYTEQTYDYGDDVLNGIFKLDANNQLYADGDTKTSDGTITRITRKYRVVDLGTLPWTTRAFGNNNGFISANLPNGVPVTGSSGLANAICSQYPIVYTGSMSITDNDKIMAVGAYYQSGCNVYVLDSAYTDATAFKTAMSGVYLVYESATPTTETSTPFASPQVCYPDGTEEYVTSNGVPVGHATEYDYDIKGLAEELIDVPDVPSSNGTYVLKATRTADGLSYSWVAG